MSKRAIVGAISTIFVFVLGLIAWLVITVPIDAGYVGYRYDRSPAESADLIPGTSVINEPLKGRAYINPFTQDILIYPTTIVAKNWTRLEEGDNKVDMSMQVASKEGKNIDADIYISVRPMDMSKIISSFGTKNFDNIVNDDIYGLVKGKLSAVSQEYSVYDIQGSRAEIQENAYTLIAEVLENIYGIELVKFEIGTLVLPTDIQAKIDQKTEAMNAVELAKLDRQKQDEINQKIVDEQKAESEKELVRRQAEADAAAYERERAAEAELAVAEAQVEIARQEVMEAQLQKEAELEKQKAYTAEYFRDKELDVQREAVAKINGSVKTIITDGTGNGYAALAGLKEVLDSIE